MITFLFALFMLPAALIAPAFYLCRRRDDRRPMLLLFIHAPPIVLWWMLLTFGYGGRTSLANIVEVFYVAIAAVVSAYLKVLLVDRFTTHHLETTYAALAILSLGVFLLRGLMPCLPE